MNLKLILSFLILPIISMAQNDEVFSLQHDGQTREYEVHTPPGYDPDSDPIPLIINMHGLGSDREQQRLYSYFNLVADTAGFIVAYPQGLPYNLGNGPQNHWNAGFGTGVDDIGFIQRMLSHIMQEYAIDPYRVYATGMSNGGYMSYYLACEMEDRIAAVASVTGSMLPQVFNGCNPDRTVPTMQIHGTADLVVPFNGNPSIDAVVDSWVSRNACTPTPVIDSIPDRDMTDQTTTVKYTYTDCDDESEIWYYVVDNGGHSWPGAIPVPLLGNTSQDFKASEHIWWFFRQYEHPDPLIITSVQDGTSTIKAWPNPVHDVLHVDIDSDLRDLSILSPTGQLIRFKPQNGRVDVSDLAPGVYVGKSGQKSFRFVKL